MIRALTTAGLITAALAALAITVIGDSIHHIGDYPDWEAGL